MAWKDQLQDARFRGQVFDCVSVEDRYRRRVARHPYPYVAGEDVEDLGRDSQEINIKAVFFGDDYLARLQQFINMLEMPDAGELVHPVFGVVNPAQLLDWSIKHDADDVDYAIVELQFIRATPAEPIFASAVPANRTAMLSDAAVNVRAAAINTFAKSTHKLTGLKGAIARANALRGALAATLGKLRNMVRNVVGDLDMLADLPRSFAMALVAGLAGLVNIRSFDKAHLTSDWKALSRTFGDLVRAPAESADLPSPLDRLGGTPTGEVPAIAGGKPLQPGAAAPVVEGGAGTAPAHSDTRPATDVAMGTVADDIGRTTALMQSLVTAQLAEVAAGILTREVESPTLSTVEVERIANDTRTAAETAIMLHRAYQPADDARPVIEALRTIAYECQEAARAVIHARPPLIRRTVPSQTNLHLLAFHWYGDYTRAAELARLNPRLTQPNFVLAGEVLNAYAQ